MAEENKIVWELKDGKVFVYEQPNSTALGLRIQFAATNEGFRDTMEEVLADSDELTNPACIDYVQRLADAIEQARQSWQESLGSAPPAP